jgi:hypothetical protein
VALAILTAGSAGWAASASAQQSKGRLEAGLTWGRSFGGTFARGSNEHFDEQVESDTAIVSGVRLAYNISERFSVDVLAAKTDTTFVASADGVWASRPELGVLQIRVIESGVRYALAKGRIVPLIGIGAGIAVLDPDIPDRPDVRDSSLFSLHCSAGFKAYARPWLGLRVEVRSRAVYLGARRLDEDEGMFDGGRWFRHVEGDASLFFAF